MFARISAFALSATILLSSPVAAASAKVKAPVEVGTFGERIYPLQLPDGRLMASFVRKAPDAYQFVASFSEDGGRNWTDPRNLLHLFEVGIWRSGPTLTLPNGEQHVFLLNNAGAGTSRNDIWRVKSKDGFFWEGLSQIWSGYTTSLNSVIQLRSGRILLPFSYRTERNWSNRGLGSDSFSFLGRFSSTLFYSNDEGKTWLKSPAELKAPAPSYSGLWGAVEPVVVELLDGRVWMLLRTQMGRLYESFSTDGVTWSQAQPTRLLSSDSPAALLRLEKDRLVLFWNSCLRFPDAHGGRQVLHAAISEDEGKTWRGHREVLRDPLRAEPAPMTDHGVAYPFPTATKEGNILISAGKRQSGTILTLFNPSWLYETSQKDDFSKGLENWSTFGTKGVSVIPHPRKRGAQVLQIRKPEAIWSAAAVRNFPLGKKGRLSMRISHRAGAKGILIALTDHFSTPFDQEDHIHSLYNLSIDDEGTLEGKMRLESDRWYNLTLEWDNERRRCTVRLDKKELTVLPLRKETLGANYLRIRSTAEDTDEAGLLVESVAVNVSKSW